MRTICIYSVFCYTYILVSLQCEINVHPFHNIFQLKIHLTFAKLEIK